MQKYLQETYDVNYGVRNIYRLMKELDIVWINYRSMHPKQNSVAAYTC
ncbi:winged helix-turn-helix domain-containing protein [Psychromonas arctica]